MSDIPYNIGLLKQQIPASVKLVAVSKTKTVSEILEAYNTGQRVFGENRVQELLSKKDLLPSDIEWHLIGHLQSNKVKHIVGFISLIQSVDTFRLLEIINREAEKAGRIINCLLQLHIAEEETKFGFSMKELHGGLQSPDFQSNDFVRICGVMGMATYTENTGQIRNEFRFLVNCYNELKETYFSDKSYFNEISMGMSGDFNIALEEGTTILRIGSLIFGGRN